MGKFLDILKKLGDLSCEIFDYQYMIDKTPVEDLQEKAKREKQEEIDFFNNAMRKNSQNMKSLTYKESEDKVTDAEKKGVSLINNVKKGSVAYGKRNVLG